MCDSCGCRDNEAIAETCATSSRLVVAVRSRWPADDRKQSCDVWSPATSSPSGSTDRTANESQLPGFGPLLHVLDVERVR